MSGPKKAYRIYTTLHTKIKKGAYKSCNTATQHRTGVASAKSLKIKGNKCDEGLVTLWEMMGNEGILFLGNSKINFANPCIKCSVGFR